jgi:hypothetical protein
MAFSSNGRSSSGLKARKHDPERAGENAANCTMVKDGKRCESKKVIWAEAGQLCA